MRESKLEVNLITRRMRRMNNPSYFYCYSPRLKKRLIEAGERFICVGLNESTQRKFWLFVQNETVGLAIEAHKASRV